MRTHALDNLRTFLTILVIFHHAVIPYGGVGGWPGVSYQHRPNTSTILIAFNFINQSYFMAAFFLISGYFSSLSAQRRSRKAFMLEKWRRLGVPTVVYSLLARGAGRMIIAWRLHDVRGIGPMEEFYAGMKSVRGVNGPVWYTALLLILDGIYAISCPEHFDVQRTPQKTTEQDASANPPNSNTLSRPLVPRYVIMVLCLSAMLSFTMRLVYPIGTSFTPVGLQLGFASQYFVYYVVGIHIQRSGRYLNAAISASTIRITLFLSAIFTTTGLALISRLRRHDANMEEISKQAFGGMNMLALIYAFWNEYFGFFLCCIIFRAFHSPLLSKNWSIRGVRLAKYSYAAFLVHALVLVDLQCWAATSGVEKIGAHWTASCVGLLGTAASWVLGWVMKERLDGIGASGYL